jgi:hypothetical protein
MGGLMSAIRRGQLLRLLAVAVLLVVGAPFAARPAAAAPAAGGTWFLNWYDRISPGMTNDNIHLVNTDSATVSGTVGLAGYSAPFSLAPGEQTYVGLGAAIGGPVIVTATGSIVASQRVTYFRSFSEVYAQTASEALSSGWFPWFDNVSGGAIADNLHFLNPDPATTVNVTATVAGQTVTAAVGPQQEVFRSFPAGTIGGPVHITSSGGPILASQRAVYGQSFDELSALAEPATAGTLISNWYDNTSPGMTSDTVHLVNVEPSNPAHVSIALNGAPGTTATIAAGSELHWSFPAGTIGGPLRVTTDARIIGTQRLRYWGAFQEVPLKAAGATSAWFPWYDNASPCFVADNLHLTPAGAGSSVGTVTMPGQTAIPFTVDDGKEAILDFPPGSIGGPVHVTITGGPPVVIDKRVVICPPPPPPPPPSPRRIVVSLAQQHLWAYDHDQLILETDVTTGRPELPTPAGNYHIFYKTSPYQMISPWPYGSPYWYPSAWVNWVMEFREGGYFLHDAPWRSWFGPGSQYGAGTHGCINIPDGPMLQLYNWAQLGDRVDVNDN